MANRSVAPLLLCCVLCGCGITPQQQRFQNAFLPPAPRADASNLDPSLAEPPVFPPNFYTSDVPNLGAVAPKLPSSRSDLLIEKAEEHFQEGKKYYQDKQMNQARTAFDQAVDLMLEASDLSSDRAGYESKLEGMVDEIHRYDVAGLGSAANLDEPQYDKAPLEDILQMTFPVDPKLKTKVREQVQATVSQLPLTVNDTVLGYIHYFSGRGRNTLISGLRRAGRYRPLVQRVLDEEGVPQELIHLAQAESGFLPRAISRKAAAGMWQFVAWRGREYGLNQTRFTDDRLDPEMATRAAAHHLRDLYHEFGDWYLAMAAYDCGPGVIERAVERTGYADFFELRAHGVLPRETTNYVPIILAMTIMSNNAAEYGLEGLVPDPPLDYYSLKMSSPTHLALISDLTNTPTSELQALNPALLRGLAPAGYLLHVPKGSCSYLRAALEMVPPDRRASWRMHTVEVGETLASIGRRYRTTAATIAAANHMRSETPAAGDHLLIPAAYHEPAPIRTAAQRHAHGASAKGHRSTNARRAEHTKTRVHRAAAFPQAPGELARAQH